MRWFHFVKEQTVNVTIRQPLYCKIMPRLLGLCNTMVAELSHYQFVPRQSVTTAK